MPKGIRELDLSIPSVDKQLRLLISRNRTYNADCLGLVLVQAVVCVFPLPITCHPLSGCGVTYFTGSAMTASHT